MDVLKKTQLYSKKVQNEAARFVTGLTRSVSLENLYKECEWNSIAKKTPI